MKEPQSFEFTTSISSDDGLPFVIEVHFHDESDIWISHNKKPLKWTYLPDDDQTRIKEMVEEHIFMLDIHEIHEQV